MDNLSLSKGRHYLRMGGDFRVLEDIFIVDGFIADWWLPPISASSPATARPATSTLDPRPAPVPCRHFPALHSIMPCGHQSTYRGLFNSYVAAGYIQDTWRARRNLTVNMGLRYEYFSVPTEANNQIWNYDPAANGLVQQNHTQVFDPFGYNCTEGRSRA